MRSSREGASRRRAAGSSTGSGLRWQIVPAGFDEMMRDQDPVRSKKVTDAMPKMVKLDIAALEKAYRS